MRHRVTGTNLRAAAAVAVGLFCCAGMAALAASGRTAGVVENIGIELGNAFVAQRVTQSVVRSVSGREWVSEIVDDVARDSSGRVRFEHAQRLNPNARSETVTFATSDGQTFTTTLGELARRIVVYEGMEDQIVTLRPGLRVAEVRAWDGEPPLLPGTRAYSSFFRHASDWIVPLNTRVEDLGVKDIEGYLAHGYRETHSDTVHVDGTRTASSVHEIWVSDELAATLLEIQSWTERGLEKRVSLTNISQKEPDSSLFEIPATYKVNPTSAEMPCQVRTKP